MLGEYETDPFIGEERLGQVITEYMQKQRVSHVENSSAQDNKMYSCNKHEQTEAVPSEPPLVSTSSLEHVLSSKH